MFIINKLNFCLILVLRRILYTSIIHPIGGIELFIPPDSLKEDTISQDTSRTAPPRTDRGHRRQSWGVGGVTNPQDFGLGSRVGEGRRADREGSLTGRETLLYLIMYRKYVREW